EALAGCGRERYARLAAAREAEVAEVRDLAAAPLVDAHRERTLGDLDARRAVGAVEGERDAAARAFGRKGPGSRRTPRLAPGRAPRIGRERAAGRRADAHRAVARDLDPRERLAEVDLDGAGSDRLASDHRSDRSEGLCALAPSHAPILTARSARIL